MTILYRKNTIPIVLSEHQTFNCRATQNIKGKR